MTPVRHIAFVLAVLASPCALADHATTAPDSTGAAAAGAASRGPSDNLCFGGLEDGKIIVSEPYLENSFKQTTRLGCEVDGGSPVTMPDLPPPDAAKTRLV